MQPTINLAEKRPDARTLGDITREVVAARTQWPSPNHLLAALTEEVGELAQAMLHAAYEGGDPARIREEAMQVACVAIRIMEEGDPTIVPFDVGRLVDVNAPAKPGGPKPTPQKGNRQ